MRRPIRFLVMGALLVVLGSCATGRYVVDWDTRHNFSGAGTYAWFQLAPQPDRGEPPTQANAIVAGRIHRAVDQALAAKGFSKAEVGKADFMVTYALVLRPRLVMVHTGWAYPFGGWGWGGWGWGGWGGWGGGWTSSRTFTEGTLVVDILDGKNRQLVWRGVADGAFTRPNPSDERVARVVARVLRDFPPA
jgi:hypothetical protein